MEESKEKKWKLKTSLKTANMGASDWRVQEYKIEYKYNISNLVHMHKIIICHNNLIPSTSFSTGEKQGGAGAWGQDKVAYKPQEGHTACP